MKRIALVAPLLLLALACPVHAAPQLRLGGDYVLDGGPGIFSLALGLDTPLARAISVGGRFGMLVSTSPTTAGVPLDVFLRVHAGRFYFEGMGGPWIFFKGDTVQGHAGFGFGIVTRTLEFGGEVGWLSGFSSATIGGRLAFRI